MKDNSVLSRSFFAQRRVPKDDDTGDRWQGKAWNPWTGLIVATLGFLSFVFLFAVAIGVDYYAVRGVDIVTGTYLYNGGLQPLPISAPVQCLMPLGETLAITSGLADSLSAMTVKSVDSHRRLRRGIRLAIMLSGMLIAVGIISALFQLVFSPLRYSLTSGGDGVFLEFFIGWMIGVAPVVDRRKAKESGG